MSIPDSSNHLNLHLDLNYNSNNVNQISDNEIANDLTEDFNPNHKTDEKINEWFTSNAVLSQFEEHVTLVSKSSLIVDLESSSHTSVDDELEDFEFSSFGSIDIEDKKDNVLNKEELVCSEQIEVVSEQIEVYSEQIEVYSEQIEVYSEQIKVFNGHIEIQSEHSKQIRIQTVLTETRMTLDNEYKDIGFVIESAVKEEILNSMKNNNQFSLEEISENLIQKKLVYKIGINGERIELTNEDKKIFKSVLDKALKKHFKEYFGSINEEKQAEDVKDKTPVKRIDEKPVDNNVYVVDHIHSNKRKSFDNTQNIKIALVLSELIISFIKKKDEEERLEKQDEEKFRYLMQIILEKAINHNTLNCKNLNDDINSFEIKFKAIKYNHLDGTLIKIEKNINRLNNQNTASTKLDITQLSWKKENI